MRIIGLTPVVVAILAVGWTTVGLTQTAQRDFSKELSNKLKGTFTVAIAGAMSLREPVGSQISDDLRRTFSEAHTAIAQVDLYDADPTEHVWRLERKGQRRADCRPRSRHGRDRRPTNQ